MGTQGMVSILDETNMTKFKIVAGSDGHKTHHFIRALFDSDIDEQDMSVRWLYKLASQFIGSENNLVVISKDSEFSKNDDEDTPPLFRATFDCPWFNPRWPQGTVEHGYMVRYDRRQAVPIIDPSLTFWSDKPFGVIGNTLRTVSGITFDLAAPTAEMVDIEDIAHVTARIPRFGGHINAEHYSVAEHALHCWERSKFYSANPEQQLAVLLHDATEAYVQDIIKPLKIMLPHYEIIEEGVEGAIAEAFDIDFGEHHELIKLCDNELLVHEKQKLITDADTFVFEGQDRIQRFTFDPDYYAPTGAKKAFLRAFHSVCDNRVLV